MLHPGMVVSRNDGDTHYVNADQLAYLYQVNPRDCIVAREGGRFGHARLPGDVHLYPRFDGDYPAFKNR